MNSAEPDPRSPASNDNGERTTSVSASRPRQPARLKLFARQRQLLTLLEALGGRVSNLDFQKLLFLYCQEPGVEDLYEFVPYKLGAFSFLSYADRRKLIERGLLVDDEQYWKLSAEGGRVVDCLRDLSVAAFVRRHGGLRGDALVAETYRRFPYYAIRSEVAKRLLRHDKAALRRIEAARPKPQAAGLATIGYEGRSLESYLNTLLRADVSFLCDVRRNPLSRKYGFSKSTLSNACERVGVRYRHLPELGIGSAKRRHLETQADYDALFADYERKSLPEQGQALAQIRSWIRSGERVALTCYERLATQCHRHCIAKALERDARRRIVAQHL